MRGDEVSAADLQIAGLTAMSTVDWPGKLVATVFTQGCPWNCSYCQNSAILDPHTSGSVSFAEVIALLEKRHGLLDGVVFSGGEATRQGAVVPAARQVKELGFAVGLHTAGPYPRRLAQLLAAGLLDWVGLDLKATKEDYPQVVRRGGAGVKAYDSLAVLLNYATAHPGFDYEVRITAFPGSPGGEYEVAKFAKKVGVRTLALQKARELGTPQDFKAQAPDWDSKFAELQSAIAKLGFANFVVRAE